MAPHTIVQQIHRARGLVLIQNVLDLAFLVFVKHVTNGSLIRCQSESSPRQIMPSVSYRFYYRLGVLLLVGGGRIAETGQTEPPLTSPRRAMAG